MSKILQTAKDAIHSIRGQNVMIDADLAKIYGVETKRLNEQVRRNIQKFPPDFMFQLTKDEYHDLRTQNAALEKTTDSLRSQNATIEKSNRGTHRKYLPYAFTEHGVLQVANVINSELADKVSVFVIRAFIELRETIIAQQGVIYKKSKALNSGSQYDDKLNHFFKEIRPKLYTEKVNAFISILSELSNQLK